MKQTALNVAALYPAAKRAPRLRRKHEVSRSAGGKRCRIVNLRPHRLAHGIDDPSADAGALGGRAVGPTDAVVLDNEFRLFVRQLPEPNADFSDPVRIGIFERVGDEFGDHHPEVDAGIGFKLEPARPRATRSCRDHGCASNRAGDRVARSDTRPTRPSGHRRSRTDAYAPARSRRMRPLRFREGLLGCTILQCAFDCRFTKDETRVRLLATR